MSGDPEQEYFADGMVEEIITALSRASHTHCSRVTFSPMKRLASVEVTTGWSPRMSAEIPAGTP
jgi:TolB-like protein